MDWVGVELVDDTVYLVVELEWRARGEFGGTNLELPGRVIATGSLYLSDAGWRTFGVALADGGEPVRMFDGAWQVTWREGFAFASPDRDNVTATVRVVEVGTSILPYENVRMVLPPFLLERMRGVERAEMAVIALDRLRRGKKGNWTSGKEARMGMLDGDAQHRKDRPRDTRDTPTRKGKEGIEFLREDTDRPVNPPLLDSGASRPSASPVSAKGCEGLWSLSERVLGWFDPEGIAKPKGQLNFSKEGAGPSSATGPGMIEGGLRKVVSSLTSALSKNQGYLADAKKKPTFDGENITKFLIDYENLAAVLRWTEEEKMEHLGQHVPLNLGRDIMAIVATSGSWKEARDMMMRKYLADEQMATEAEKSTVQRKHSATYSDFLREFTLVALRIPGVMDRIMSKYFLKQFTEFDKEMIGMHLHNDAYMADIEDPMTGQGELLRLMGTGGDTPKGKLATWSPSFEESARKGAFARMEGMGERVEIMIEEAFSKKEWVKMGLPMKKRSSDEDALGVMVVEKETEVELGASLPKHGEIRDKKDKVALEIPDLLQLVKAIKYHKVAVDPAALASFEERIQNGYCLNGELFDYKIERVAGLRNRADRLSRVALTPEGLEEAEPIDAFLDYEGGTLVVDSEMAGTTCTTGELLIKALEKGPPTVVAELREGTATRVGRREEKDAWGSVVKPRDEQIALAVEGGWRRVMSMKESQELEMQHYQAYQVDNNQTGTQEEEQFFLIKSYEGIEVRRTKMAPNNENDINQANLNVDDPWRQPERPQNRNRPVLQPRPPVRTGKRKMQACRPSPTKEGDVLRAWPEDKSEQEREESREEKGTEDQHKEEPGQGSRKDAKGSTEDDSETGEDIPKIVIVNSDDEMDRVSRPRLEGQASTSRASEEVHDWDEVFGPTPSHWFEVWANTFRHDWIIIARSLMAAGERVTPTDFFSKETLHDMKATLDEIRTYGLGVAPPPKTEEGRGAKRQRTDRDTGN
ncbi:hypothetical protein CBR_g37517 [Chara braunii]|uniref:Retrotransposon gag domain-containing protein n=1 Tax=Chara braunii TaxID=69332 RepID=A0A388LMZ6_CHABU|nr:hypothetical protein CBR_g37517 [Chara braunii]|eukprot:GBG83716.1 hypothetical protein CBR_g37517 [Chara braunii]